MARLLLVITLFDLEKSEQPNVFSFIICQIFGGILVHSGSSQSLLAESIL